MEIELSYINPETLRDKSESNDKSSDTLNQCTWGSRWKRYVSDNMDEDMKASPISFRVDRAILNDIQITSASQVDDIIEFLNNLKPSLLI